jgi:DNA helicase II / ATP-dependent DNA helicase PcrA
MSELLTEFDHVVRRAMPAELYTDLSPAQADEAAEDAALAAGHEQRPRVVLGATRGGIYLMRLRAYLEQFAGRAAEETLDSAPEARNAVQIMTIHQAKGLEFPVVFVPALVQGRFPSRMMGRRQQWYLPDDLFDRARYEGLEDDEARLLYVALTRARELLIVSWFTQHRVTKAFPSPLVVRYLRDSLAQAGQLGSTLPSPLVGVAQDELLDVDFSSLVTYMECGYRYWLRHVCRFQPPLVPELGFGKVLHHAVAELARLASEGKAPSDADVERILDRSFYLPFAGPVPATRLRDAARRRTNAYVHGYGEELARTIKPEARFEVPLANARLRGRIDLLLQARGGPPDQVELIDFKTSSNRPPKRVHVNQLRMYAAAAERLGLKPVRLAIHDLDADDGGRIEVSNDERERETFRNQLEQWVEGIRHGTFRPVDDTSTCRACDFRRFCGYAPDDARHWRTPGWT